MPKTITIRCDNPLCGKRKGEPGDTLKNDAWLELCNLDLPSASKDQVRLKEPHFFCSFLCLKTWVVEAIPAALELVEGARNLHPRGTFVNEKLGLMY